MNRDERLHGHVLRHVQCHYTKLLREIQRFQKKYHGKFPQIFLEILIVFIKATRKPAAPAGRSAGMGNFRLLLKIPRRTAKRNGDFYIK